MVQAFREAKPATREEFLSAFEALIKDWDFKWMERHELESLAAEATDKFGISGAELQRFYWERAGKSKLEEETSSGYIIWRQLRKQFEVLEAFGGTVPEHVVREATPHLTRYLDQELRSGYPTFDVLNWLIPLLPFLESEARQKFDQVALRFAERGAEDYASGVRDALGFLQAERTELEFVVSTLAKAGKVSGELHARMIGRAISHVANVNADSAIPVLAALDWKPEANAVYNALVIGVANSARFRSSWPVRQWRDESIDDLLRLMTAIDKTAAIPEHTMFLVASVVDNVYGEAAAFSRVKGFAVQKASQVTQDVMQSAKESLEVVIKQSTNYNISAAALTLASNLVKVYANVFGSAKAAPVANDIVALIQKVLGDVEHCHAGYDFALAFYGSEEAIDKGTFSKSANNVPNERQWRLDRNLRGLYRQRWGGEYGSAREKTQDLQRLVEWHKFLEAKFGPALDYRLADEVKALAPGISPDSDVFVVQYFGMVARAHGALHHASVKPVLPPNVDTSKLAAAFVGKLQRARNNPRLRERPDERAIVEAIYNEGYSAIFGQDLEEAVREAVRQSVPVRPQHTPQPTEPYHAPNAAQPQHDTVIASTMILYLGGKLMKGYEPDRFTANVISGLEGKLAAPAELVLFDVPELGKMCGFRIRLEDYAAAIADQTVQRSVQCVEFEDVSPINESNNPGNKFKLATAREDRSTYLTVEQGTFAIHHLNAIAALLTEKPKERNIAPSRVR